jgi:hypothetical protein
VSRQLDESLAKAEALRPYFSKVTGSEHIPSSSPMKKPHTVYSISVIWGPKVLLILHTISFETRNCYCCARCSERGG